MTHMTSVHFLSGYETREPGCTARKTQDRAWTRDAERSGNSEPGQQREKRAAWASHGRLAAPSSPSWEPSWLGRASLGRSRLVPCSSLLNRLALLLPAGLLGGNAWGEGSVSFNPISALPS